MSVGRLLSNGLLLVGIGLLIFWLVQVLRSAPPDAMAPALAAFCIGSSAVLDRLRSRNTE